jgi:hypothetical protein
MGCRLCPCRACRQSRQHRRVRFYDPVHWPILLLPRLALFLRALAPLALVHIAHLRPRIGAGAAMAVPIAGLGGAVALIAFFAFYTDMVLNWRQPHWATLLPRRLQLAAAIPGQLGLIGGAWFGVIETAVLRRVSRPRRGFLLVPAAILCAIAIVVPYYFAAHKREAVWVMAALVSLPLAGSAYAALVETVLRPDAAPVFINGTIERIGGKRLFARWGLRAPRHRADRRLGNDVRRLPCVRSVRRQHRAL